MAWIPPQNRRQSSSEWTGGETSVVLNAVNPEVGTPELPPGPLGPEVLAARQEIGAQYAEDPLRIPTLEEAQAHELENERRRATLGVWGGDGLQRTVGQEETRRTDDYVHRSLDQLGSGAIGAAGNGLGRAMTDDPEKQLAIGDYYANVGVLSEIAGMGPELNTVPELPERRDHLISERAPRSRAYEDYQAADSTARAAESASKLDRDPSDHGYADHGAHTTYDQHKTRVETGVSPSGRMSKTSRSTAFSSNAAQLEAVGRAKQRVTTEQPPEYTIEEPDVLKPNVEPYIVGGPKSGYGSGAEAARTPDGKIVKPKTGQPTIGTDPRAKVYMRYDPAANDWRPVTSYPTDEPETK